jgi:uncharacterized repeat protein (TIGR04138 family)
LTYAQEVLGLGHSAGEASDTELAGVVRHVTGQQLCLALKRLAHEQYGYMAKLVLATWGIRSTSDFGEIVYNLIKIGEMSKSDDDRREDFDEVFDFDEALVRDYAMAQRSERCRPSSR